MRHDYHYKILCIVKALSILIVDRVIILSGSLKANKKHSEEVNLHASLAFVIRIV